MLHFARKRTCLIVAHRSRIKAERDAGMPAIPGLWLDLRRPGPITVSSRAPSPHPSGTHSANAFRTGSNRIAGIAHASITLK